MPPPDVKFNFVLRCWAAAHGIGLYVGNKLLLLFLLTCLYSWEIFLKISKEKKDSLWCSKATRVYKKTYRGRHHSTKAASTFLEKKMLCSSVTILILYI